MQAIHTLPATHQGLPPAMLSKIRAVATGYLNQRSAVSSRYLFACTMIADRAIGTPVYRGWLSDYCFETAIVELVARAHPELSDFSAIDRDFCHIEVIDGPEA